VTRTIQSLQRLGIQQAQERYIVDVDTFPSKRLRCWICGGEFEIGDGMTIAITEDGNKSLHSRCYQAQEDDGDETKGE